MLLATKIGSTTLAFTLLAAAMFLQNVPRRSGATDSGQIEPATFVMRDEIAKMQEVLRYEGDYQGKIDGVFGLRTRASIRAYQKAQSLPITGQVDVSTADRLGVRPEASWDTSKDIGREVGPTEKPSAGIQQSSFRASKTRRKEVARPAVIKDRDDDKQQHTRDEQLDH